MAKYQKYAEYKDSGVEWLGEIPIHWDLFALKRSIDKCTNGFWGAEPDGINDLCVLRVADFDRDNFKINLDKLTYRSVLPKEAESRLLKNGDLLIEKSGGGEKTLVGCVVQFDKDFPAITSNFVAKMTPNSNMDSRFLTYSFAHLYSGRVNYPAIKQTTGIQNLDSEAYLMENFCFPSKMEQIKIANFLDHETAKIDSLIEKQQQLIQLLKEKRQAVISHAVTKGLDPRVKMKDSGVEWLGQVPEHWKTLNLRWKINIASGEGISSNEIESEPELLKGIPVIGGNGVMGFTNKINTRSALAIGRVGALCGNIHLINYESWITDNALKISQWHDFDSGYLVFLLRAARLNDMANKSAQPLITGEQVKSLRVVIPPIEEQKCIVSKIEDMFSTFDRLIEKAESAIQLMQERRTALISAAVTGKIDVQNWQNPTEAKMEFSA